MDMFKVMFFIFLTLKLLGLINWPWMWVLSPLWIGLLVFLTIITILTAFELIFKKEE
jgi:hypothetical protein